MVDVTVCILTFNGEEFLDDLLNAVYNQRTNRTFEVLIIDSGSKDKTLDIVSRYEKTRLHKIDNSEFGHGRTRNLAVELSNSEFIAFLTQDAVPNHDRWLESLLEPFELFENASCVFGKQVPRWNCNITVKREVNSVFNSFGDDASFSVQRVSELTKERNIANNFLSDVNSAFRRSALVEVPFRDLNYAEDQAVGMDHMAHGWLKVYSPLGSVFHSHDYPPRKYFHRKVDEMLGVYEALGAVHSMPLKLAIRRTITGTLRDWNACFSDREYGKKLKIKNFLLAPRYNYLLMKAFRITRDPERHNEVRKHSLEKKLRS